MACRRSIVFQALTSIYTNVLRASYSNMANVSRSMSDSIAGQAPEATPTVRIIEGASRLIGDKANVFGMVEVDATLECRLSSSVDNRGLAQDRINEFESALDNLLDHPIVIANVGTIVVLPNGDRVSSPGTTEAALDYPIRVRFDRELGPLGVVNG